MFEGLFGDENPLDQATDAVLESQAYGKHSRNMADELELPPLPRKSFIGLKNQGATCYLNSFYQSLFMIPPIQKIFLELDLASLFGDGKRKPCNNLKRRSAGSTRSSPECRSCSCR